MKRIVIIILMLCLIGIYNTKDVRSVENETNPGKKVFEQRGCAGCHDAAEDQRRDGLGPSWKQIAKAYENNDKDLGKFLKGECKPIVDKAKFSIMHGQIVKLKTCSESDLKALERFIIKEMLNPHRK